MNQNAHALVRASIKCFTVGFLSWQGMHFATSPGQAHLMSWRWQMCAAACRVCAHRGSFSVCKCSVEVGEFPGEEQPGLKRKVWSKRSG